MYPSPVGTWVLWGFPLLAGGLVIMVAFAHQRAAATLGVEARVARRRTLVFLGAAMVWQLIVSGFAGAGVLARFDAWPPPVIFMLLGVGVCGQLLARSSVGATLTRGLPLAALVGFQAFRLPLELLMHEAAMEGVMPAQMTFTGWNFDILTGVSAIGVALLLVLGVGGRTLVFAWNAVGTALLLTIVIIAVASTPVFAAFGAGPALNTFIAYTPFTTLPTVMVLLAMAGHVMLWRRLAIDRGAESRAAIAGA